MDLQEALQTWRCSADSELGEAALESFDGDLHLLLDLQHINREV